MSRTIALAAFFPTGVFGQKVGTEGKAWLSSKTDPPGMNVGGKGYAGRWGLFALNQSEGGRKRI